MLCDGNKYDVKGKVISIFLIAIDAKSKGHDSKKLMRLLVMSNFNSKKNLLIKKVLNVYCNFLLMIVCMTLASNAGIL